MRYAQKGFTFIEVITVIAVIAIIATISAAAFQNIYRTSSLRAAESEVYRALTDARTRTLASEDDTVYGVHLSTSAVTRFVGGTYSAGSVTNKTYTFEGGVYATGTLAISGANIIFTRLTGEPSATGTLYMVSADETASSSVVMYGSGLIEIQ